MKKCSKCGKITDSMFCPNCGNNMSEATNIDICPKCGQETNSRFCPNCGHNMNEDKESTTEDELFENSFAQKMPLKDESAQSVNPDYKQESDLGINSLPENIEFSSGAFKDEGHKAKLYTRTWFIILLLIIFFPVGLFLMWKYTKWKKFVKIIITIVIGIFFIIGLFMPAEETSDYGSDDSYTSDEYDEDYSVNEEETESVELFTTEADYSAVSYDSLARTPDDYMFSKVKGTGEVIQVLEGDGETQLRIALDDYYDDVVLVYYDSNIVSERVLEDDIVTYYGTSYGLYTYESTMGGDITVPLIEVHKIVIN